MSYQAPVADIMHSFKTVSGIDQIQELPAFEHITEDLLEQIMEEAGKFSAGVLAPLNSIGDHQGSYLENGVVRTPEGWAQAYKSFAEGGWNAVPFSEDIGGMGLPWLVATAVAETVHSANTSFGLCPMLTQAAIELLGLKGTDWQKEIFLPKIVSGEWTGTMNLTEPQAGSDLAAVKMRAVPDGDVYRLKGQKIFITYGDHDMTDNIIHLVLARIPDAPPGIKGISLFLVPKIMVDTKGNLKGRNDVRCITLEKKLGIHASPTCVMSFGETDGAVGYLIGEENRGIEYMFTMMNNARLGVGLEGLAISEGAYQKALSYAKERVQGPVSKSAGTKTILGHPDVKRMILVSKAKIEAMRHLCYYAAFQLDVLGNHTSEDSRKKAQNIVDVLIPMVKAWCTDNAVDISSTSLQVFGGMGFVEETGIAQFYRDARITPIYEGTNGIQAKDLVMRKVIRDQGAAFAVLEETLEEMITSFAESQKDDANHISDALKIMKEAKEWLLKQSTIDMDSISYGAVHFLNLCSICVGGVLLAKGTQVATDVDHSHRLQLFSIYRDQILPMIKSEFEKMKAFESLQNYQEAEL